MGVEVVTVKNPNAGDPGSNAGAMNDKGELLDDESFRRIGFTQTITHQNIGDYTMPA